MGIIFYDRNLSYQQRVHSYRKCTLYFFGKGNTMLSFSYNKTAWLSSLFIHLLLFISLASAGFFTLNHVNASSDTAIYIVDNNPANSSSGVSNNNGSSSTNTNDITLSATQNDVSNSKKSTTQASASFSFQKNPYASTNKYNSGNSTSTNHNSAGIVGNQYTGNSAGKGNGTGTNTGTTTGSGEGYGSGSNIGNGINSNSDALRVSIPPRPTNSPSPIYPDSMRSSGLEGTTSLTMLISASGHVENVTITSSSGETAFDNAAINAAYKYKFIPARNSRNQNVRCRISKNFMFHLNS